MNPELTTADLQKPKSRAREKSQRTKARESTYKANCRLVSIRDAHKCRVCGARDGLQHHHIRFRSQGRDDSTANLLLVCGGCHSDVHAYRLVITGNADSVVTCEQRGETFTR